jgi:hypothetical protein
MNLFLISKKISFRYFFFNDSQNIHNHSIQESLNNSINNIMQQKFIINEDNIMNEILNDTILTDKCKELR